MYSNIKNKNRSHLLAKGLRVSHVFLSSSCDCIDTRRDVDPDVSVSFWPPGFQSVSMMRVAKDQPKSWETHKNR